MSSLAEGAGEQLGGLMGSNFFACLQAAGRNSSFFFLGAGLDRGCRARPEDRGTGDSRGPRGCTALFHAALASILGAAYIRNIHAPMQ